MSQELNENTVVVIPSGVRLKKDAVRDRFVLLAPERAVIVDPIAVAILNEIDGVKSFSEIILALAGTFNADPKVITDDVKKFMLDLFHRRMLEFTS